MKTVFFDVKIVKLLTKTVKIILKLAQENPQFFYQAFLKSLAYQTKGWISLKINQQFIFDVVFFIIWNLISDIYQKNYQGLKLIN
ncbi:hypothetical protein [Mesomycoplasma hyopneumoniae]|uniref:Uncharacterized protein n=1 Tax=Mesomycoplasma hyopneumoniae (strain J / ATCC 25934 / NCTC 10110) TaxID=262719 RepID=Q4A9J7_MESHJ|nr:hypothetical protein [Mesomycoplasma hyopneumoniae]AAZ44574.1 hypothetical protein MHJ_0488 [Mesomycoplasma hyopneumoniae J]